uniref:Cell division cycle protein 26 homolog n=1 Tax=Elaeophora elaphi TaxID=1147741 RepID=A0A0R3RS95_9BILA
MLRRQPTEIVLKLDEIDEMIMEIKKQAAGVHFSDEGEEVEKVLTQNVARSRIGAPSPRIRMTQAADTQLASTSSSATPLP